MTSPINVLAHLFFLLLGGMDFCNLPFHEISTGWKPLGSIYPVLVRSIKISFYLSVTQGKILCRLYQFHKCSSLSCTSYLHFSSHGMSKVYTSGFLFIQFLFLVKITQNVADFPHFLDGVKDHGD